LTEIGLGKLNQAVAERC